MVNSALSEIFQLPRFAAISTFAASTLWYRYDGHNGGLWLCLLSLAVFAGVAQATLSALTCVAKGVGSAPRKESSKLSTALKALGSASGVLSSLFSAILVTILILGLLATSVRMVLPVRSQNWWSCVAVLLISLNNMAALCPTMLLTAYRWSTALRAVSPALTSPSKLLNSLQISSIILDSSFLDRESAESDLAVLKQAQIQALIVESREGPDAEKAMSKTVLLSQHMTALPLVVKLRTVLEAKESADHPCRDVYVLLNDAEVAVVSGTFPPPPREVLLSSPLSLDWPSC